MGCSSQFHFLSKLYGQSVHQIAERRFTETRAEMLRDARQKPPTLSCLLRQNQTRSVPPPSHVGESFAAKSVLGLPAQKGGLVDKIQEAFQNPACSRMACGKCGEVLQP